MKKVVLSVLGVVILGGGVWFYMIFNRYAPDTYVKETVVKTREGTTTVSITTNTETRKTSTTTPEFTMSDISTHKDAASCYTVISGSVYDLTMWVNIHPGGKGAILSICGIDGTEKFMNKHKGAQKQMDILTRFKIGVLK